MSTKLIQDYLICKEVSLPGVTEIYMKNRSELGPYWFYEQTNVKQFGMITGVISQTGSWYKIVCNRNTIKFNQSQANDISRLYNMTFDMIWNKINYIKRDLIEQFVVSDEIVIIFKDTNGLYWLMGETEGCQTLTWNFGTGDKAGQNETSIQLTCAERFPIREVDPSFINSITPILMAICDLTWTEICNNEWANLCADYQWN